jgi:folate-dependent phosphoribosylglycinamide formyltransferase PurN
MTLAFLALEEHPYAREMLRHMLARGFCPDLVIEEISEVASIEREKFLRRIEGHEVAPTIESLLAGRTVARARVADHNDAQCEALLRTAAPTLLVLGGTRILAPRIFERGRDGCLNAHPGLLPQVRGSASVAWALHRDERVGCTCHFVERGIDTGAVVERREISVSRADTYESLCWRTLRLSAELMSEALAAHAAGTLRGVPQGDGPPAHRDMPADLLQEVRRKLAEGRYRHLVD